MNKFSLVAFLVPLAAVACTAASAPPPRPIAPSSATTAAVAVAPSSSESSLPTAPRPVYRLEFTLRVTEAGKAPTETAYQLTVQDNDAGEIRTGDNVPLIVPPPKLPEGSKGAPPAPGPMMRQDVGVVLRVTVHARPNDLMLQVDLESSSIAASSVIHKTTMKGDALVTPGKPSVVATSEDATTKEKYELLVVATAL